MFTVISLLIASIVLLPIYLVSSETNQKRIENIYNKAGERVIKQYESKYSVE